MLLLPPPPPRCFLLAWWPSSCSLASLLARWISSRPVAFLLPFRFLLVFLPSFLALASFSPCDFLLVSLPSLLAPPVGVAAAAFRWKILTCFSVLGLHMVKYSFPDNLSSHGILYLAKLEKLAGVQQLAALNTLECLADMTERGRQRSGTHRDVGGEELLCPKPRRAAFGVCSALEMLKPARRLRSHTALPAEGEAGYEILDILLSKNGVGDSGNLGNSLPYLGSSPPSRPVPYFCGSPPNRAGNPLIHDVQFTQKRLPPLAPTLPHKSSCGSFGANSSFKKSSCSSHGANPSVRVEGFVSSGSDSLGVPALA